jgi:hypothetical protein
MDGMCRIEDSQEALARSQLSKDSGSSRGVGADVPAGRWAAGRAVHAGAHQMVTLWSALPETTTPAGLKRAALTQLLCPSHTATERLRPRCQQRSSCCFHLRRWQLLASDSAAAV